MYELVNNKSPDLDLGTRNLFCTFRIDILVLPFARAQSAETLVNFFFAV